MRQRAAAEQAAAARGGDQARHQKVFIMVRGPRWGLHFTDTHVSLLQIDTQCKGVSARIKCCGHKAQSFHDLSWPMSQ